MLTGWLTVKKGTGYDGHTVFEVRQESDGIRRLFFNKAVARQLYKDLGEALGVECDDRYAEGFEEAQETVKEWYEPEPPEPRQ